MSSTGMETEQHSAQHTEGRSRLGNVNNNINKDECQELDSLQRNQQQRKRADFEYKLTSIDSYITQLLLFVGFLRIKRVKVKHRQHKDKKKRRGKLDIKSKRINEQLHIDKLEKDSIQYKILTQDKSKLKVITKLELSKHIIPSSSRINKVKLESNQNWMLIHGFVFETSAFLDSHPGGVECLLDCVGVDATRVFDDVGHSDIAWEMLENSCVGVFEDYVGDLNGTNDTIDDSNCTCGCNGESIIKDKIVWIDKIFEFTAITILAIFSLLSFIYVQRKKWEE